MHAIESKAQRSQSATLIAGADNASGTHRPGYYIRGLCRARDRLRVEGNLPVAGPAEHAGEPGGRRFASSRSARDRPPRSAGGDGAALCAAQATAAVELRRAGVSPRGFGLVSGLCPLAAVLVAKEIGAAQTISAIRPQTWEAVNRAVLASAKQDKLESGATVRIDSTVTAALMHEPSDSALLWDAVRLMTRLLRQATALPGAPALHWRDRRRLAKKRAQAIEYSRSKDNRRRLYRELIAATRATRWRCNRPATGWPTSPGARLHAGALNSATTCR